MAAQLELALALDHAPELVRAHGLRDAHKRPLVSLGKIPGRPFRSYRTSPRRAWLFPEVEYGRTGSSVVALVVDCDDPAAWREGVGDLPPFNWLVRRPANDHAHIAWALARPVHRYPHARPGPLRFLGSIEDFYAAALGADAGYSAVLAHNPAQRFSSPYETEWGATEPYSLQGLADVIPFGWQPPIIPRFAIGRNVALFEAGMRWAGRAANAHLDILPMLFAANRNFANPLPLSEVEGMARSISRYRQQWQARRWHKPGWIDLQRARGLQGAVARWREHDSEAARRPWRDLGISRRTYYRRKAAGLI